MRFFGFGVLVYVLASAHNQTNNMSGWEKMFAQWQKEYYSEPFYMACQILAIVLGLMYHRKSKALRFFIFYAIFDFLMLNLLFYLDYFSGIEKKAYYKATNVINGFCFLFQVLAYYYFFTRSFKDKKLKSFIKTLRVVSVILVVFYLDNVFRFDAKPVRTFYYLSAIGYLFLLIPCFVYYFDLFRLSSLQTLFQKSSFWITSGIFFISFVSIPYFTIAGYLAHSRSHYYDSLGIILFTILYGIQFLFLSKAFTLKTELTT